MITSAHGSPSFRWFPGHRKRIHRPYLFTHFLIVPQIIALGPNFHRHRFDCFLKYVRVSWRVAAATSLMLTAESSTKIAGGNTSGLVPMRLLSFPLYLYQLLSCYAFWGYGPTAGILAGSSNRNLGLILAPCQRTPTNRCGPEERPVVPDTPIELPFSTF